MTQRGKKYLEAAKQVEHGKLYDPKDAIVLAKKAIYTKFDETLEIHLRMGVDQRQADQQVRGIAHLPNGLGKKVRVIVFAQGEAEKFARDAGAENVGAEDLIKKIEEGWLEFDIAIATPEMMSKVSKLGKILGRKGLMPNPKSGTVVQGQDLPRVLKEAQKGRVEFKLDKSSILHLPVGKVSFPEDKLLENLTSIVEAVVKAKPAGAKGQYIKSITLSTTMGPGIKLDLKPSLALVA